MVGTTSPRMQLMFSAVTAVTLALSAVSAIAQSATPNNFSAILDTPAFNDQVEQSKRQNANTLSAITPEFLAQTISNLPKIGQMGREMRFGRHKTVSQDGEKIIDLIQVAASASRSPKERTEALRTLQELSQRKVPEAVNFIGFVNEYGLFGARKEMRTALQYYRAAAAAGYQPALYNLALAEAYGKQGRQDLAQAAQYIANAFSYGEEASSRVCGFGSFINYRRGDLQAALRFTKGCNSPLIALPMALADRTQSQEKRIDGLRKSIATGADDGFELLERITRDTAGKDDQFNFCKYSLLNRYRITEKYDHLQGDAARCYEQYASKLKDQNKETSRRQLIIPGIASFVSTEIVALKDMRKSNHFHYSWSVPYLPFAQQDVDLFTPVFPGAKS